LQEQSDETYEKSKGPVEKQTIEGTSEAVKDVMKSCKTSAELLEAIFKLVLPEEKVSFLSYYRSALRTLSLIGNRS
jgi:hypothetical protein